MRRKINLLIIVVLIIGIVLTGIISNLMLKENYIENISEKLISNAKQLRTNLGYFEEMTYEEVDAFIQATSEDIHARVTIIDSEGVVITDSEAHPSELENHLDRPEIQAAFEGNIGISERYSKSVRMDMYYVAVPLEFNGEIYALRVSVPLEKINEFNRSLVSNLIFAALIGILISVIIGTLLTNRLISPIKELNVATKRIAGGSYEKKIYIESKDEIGELAKNFNKMSDEIRDKINEINENNIKNHAILSSMINGVIAMDNMKNIMFINPAAEEMFGFHEREVRGKHILEVLRSNALDEQVQKLIIDNKMTTVELELFEPEHRILNLYSNPIVTSDEGQKRIGVVIIIQDVTEMRKLEIMRKDFVANVSHELKTPLTSIKGFVETLKSGAVDNVEVRDRFLNIVDIEVGRLNTLIEDLLILSDIEKRRNHTEDEAIDIYNEVRTVVDMMEKIAQTKNVDLQFECEPGMGQLFGNAGWFKQMMINLIDNGIKYCEEQGEVTVKIYEENNEAVFVVKDNGMGIDDEHLERLFERFYRVDKARSRKVGGTGLGLAIVKHVVISLNGKIDVKSKVGAGTEFIVRVPLYKNSNI